LKFASPIARCLGERSAEVGLAVAGLEIVLMVLEEALSAFVHMGFELDHAVAAARGHMDL